MQDRQARPSNSRRARLLRWLARLFVLAGLAALAWSAAFLADAWFAQRSARHALREAVADRTPMPVPVLDGAAAALSHRAVDVGSAIAVLSIPRIDLSAAVLHGSDAQTLRRGPGHLENTAYPGETGNVVIAGHRDSFFRPLRHIRIGDDIYLDTEQGEFHYQVSSLRVVGPRDLSVIAPTDDAMLTLITCYPFRVFGNAPDRFVVRATRVVASATRPLEARTAPLAGRNGSPLMALHAKGEPATMAGPVEHDDEDLVRQAVGRYLLMQGSRLGTAADARSSGARAVNCTVTFGDGRATADCDPIADSSSDLQAHARTFMLERASDRWAIKSILVK
jgi:sortase A